jgi:serine/threonine protein kinase
MAWKRSSVRTRPGPPKFLKHLQPLRPLRVYSPESNWSPNHNSAWVVLGTGAVANPSRKLRFVQEAKAASALNHPHIVTIYDVGCADGVDYIAMELIRGRTLEQVLSRGKLRLTEALEYGAQIADALAAADAAGIVHRDLKLRERCAGEDSRKRVSAPTGPG